MTVAASASLMQGPVSAATRRQEANMMGHPVDASRFRECCQKNHSTFTFVAAQTTVAN